MFIPVEITDFIEELLLTRQSPAYFLVDPEFILKEPGGFLERYGMEGLERGRPATEQVLFLEGFLPLEESPVFLPHITTPSGIPAHVYMFRSQAGVWVLLLDSDYEAQNQRRVQQRANDLGLEVNELRRSEDALEQANLVLEDRVRERTSELVRVNEKLRQLLAEYRRKEAALVESESKFRRVSESNMIGIMFWDLSGVVTEANDAFLITLGFTRDDLMRGRIRWDNITRPELRHIDTGAIEEMRKLGACTPFERQFIRQNGSPVKLLFGAALLEGSQTKTVCFTLDLAKCK